MQEKISINNTNGEKLVGLVDWPDNQNTINPLAVLVHGFGSNKTEDGMFDDIALELTKAGIASYRFDFSGLGDSEGNYRETTLTKCMQELQSILDYVRIPDAIDESRIAIVAMSFGTSVALTLQPKDVKTFVFVGSIPHPSLTIRKLFEPYRLDEDGFSYRKTEEEEIVIGSQFWKDLAQYDPLKNAGSIKRPVCIIHGSEDEKVSAEEAKELYETLRGHKKLVIIPGADHNFTHASHRKKMVDETINWLKHHL